MARVKPPRQFKVTQDTPGFSRVTSKKYRNSTGAAKRAVKAGKPEDYYTTGKRGANSKGLPRPNRSR